MKLRKALGMLSLVGLLALLPAVPSAADPTQDHEDGFQAFPPQEFPPLLRLQIRRTSDQPDVLSGYQVHIVYAVPADGVDRGLDWNGALQTSVAAWQAWLGDQLGGPTLRVDSVGPAHARRPDITFVRLPHTDAEIFTFNGSDTGGFVRDAIEQDLRGFPTGDPLIEDSANKIYAVYYDGTSEYACGGGAWPPSLPGRVAALYLHGTPGGGPACDTTPFAPNASSPDYLEFSMLHEIVHTLGLVATCAPHHLWKDGSGGHVSDDPNDLMWAGDGAWFPDGPDAVVLDAGNDDYARAGGGSCPNLARSVYLTPTPPNAQTPPGPPTVPDVRELLSAQAAQRIRDAGLTPRFTGQSGRGAWVYEQTPRSGTLVAAGSTVTLELRTSPAP